MNVIQLSRIEEGNPQSYAKYLSEHIAMNTLHGNNDFFFLKCDALIRVLGLGRIVRGGFQKFLKMGKLVM